MKKKHAWLVLTAFLLLFIIFHQWEHEKNKEETEIRDGAVQEAGLFSAEGKQYRGMPFTDLLADVYAEFNLDKDQISLIYMPLQHLEAFRLNADRIMYAASTTKVAIAALYADLISEGKETWDQELDYREADYEEGEGEVTNAENKTTYSIEELVKQMLVYSDNTATNILSNHYMEEYAGDYSAFREAILAESGDGALQSQEVYAGNFVTAEMLAQTLKHLTDEEKYAPIIKWMQEGQNDFRFKKYLPEGMAAKSGSFEDWEHDTGIFYLDEEPAYILVVLTEGIDHYDEFLAKISLQIYLWTQQNWP